MKTRYIVYTHLGPFETWATLPEKALANVRWRVYGGRCDARTWSWEVVEAWRTGRANAEREQERKAVAFARKAKMW